MNNEFDYDDESHNYVVTGCEDDNWDYDSDPLYLEDCEENKTMLVERFVTYANAREFDEIRSETFIETLTGFPETHWANQFVADELCALIEDSPSDEEIMAYEESAARAIYALYN
jgi:hypothetical protein